VSPSFEADMDRFHGACVQEQRATRNEHAAMHAAAIVRARPICTASTERLFVCLRLNLALVDCARAILAAHVCVHAHVHECIARFVHVSIHLGYAFPHIMECVRAFVHTYACVRVRACVRACVRVHACMRVRACVRACTCVRACVRVLVFSARHIRHGVAWRRSRQPFCFAAT
jgi:hypothetical protein